MSHSQVSRQVLQEGEDGPDRAPRPRVSVLIPAYNAERWLERAVQSALDQTAFVDTMEIILVNDGSTDGTAAIIGELAARHPRIVPVGFPANRGPAAARNAGFERARGDWIAVLDADDAFAPGRLDALVHAAEAGNLDVIADLPILYDLAAGAPAPQDHQLPASGAISRLSFEDFLRRDAETGLDFGLLKPLFHQRLNAQGLLRYPEDLRHGEDCALYISLVRAGFSFGVLRRASYIFSTRIGAISGARSPGSVTDVDYLAVAAEAERLRTALQAQGELDETIDTLLQRRRADAERQNRIYGWTCLRRGEWGLLWRWMRKDAGNPGHLRRMLLAKLGGHRGLPD